MELLNEVWRNRQWVELLENGVGMWGDYAMEQNSTGDGGITALVLSGKPGLTRLRRLASWVRRFLEEMIEQEATEVDPGNGTGGLVGS